MNAETKTCQNCKSQFVIDLRNQQYCIFIGGLGSIPGAFLGSYLLGFVENFGIWGIGSEWKAAVAFGLLILFLIFRPQGILGKK
jgi:branched-subunit amino acid ABC-type transport system permease component